MRTPPVRADELDLFFEVASSPNHRKEVEQYLQSMFAASSMRAEWCFVAQEEQEEDSPPGRVAFWTLPGMEPFALVLLDLNDEVIERLVAHAEAAPSHHSTIDVWYQGGALSRTEASETAFGDRSAPIWIGVEANWEHAQDDEANIAWVRECVADRRRFSGGAYLNFAGFFEEGGRLIREAFGENHERLVALKNKYDPTNLFRLNQNIKPTT